MTIALEELVEVSLMVESAVEELGFSWQETGSSHNTHSTYYTVGFEDEEKGMLVDMGNLRIANHPNMTGFNNVDHNVYSKESAEDFINILKAAKENDFKDFEIEVY